MDDFYKPNTEQTDFLLSSLSAYRESMHDLLYPMSDEDKKRHLLLFKKLSALYLEHLQTGKTKRNDFKHQIISNIEQDMHATPK
jgi:hypothetical protein